MSWHPERTHVVRALMLGWPAALPMNSFLKTIAMFNKNIFIKLQKRSFDLITCDHAARFQARAQQSLPSVHQQLTKTGRGLQLTFEHVFVVLPVSVILGLCSGPLRRETRYLCQKIVAISPSTILPISFVPSVRVNRRSRDEHSCRTWGKEPVDWEECTGFGFFREWQE